MHLVETWCPSIRLRKNLEVSLCKFFKAVTVVFLFLFWHFFYLLLLYVFCPFILIFFYTEWGFLQKQNAVFPRL